MNATNNYGLCDGEVGSESASCIFECPPAPRLKPVDLVGSSERRNSKAMDTDAKGINYRSGNDKIIDLVDILLGQHRCNVKNAASQSSDCWYDTNDRLVIKGGI